MLSVVEAPRAPRGLSLLWPSGGRSALDEKPSDSRKSVDHSLVGGSSQCIFRTRDGRSNSISGFFEPAERLRIPYEVKEPTQNGKAVTAPEAKPHREGSQSIHKGTRFF